MRSGARTIFRLVAAASAVAALACVGPEVSLGESGEAEYEPSGSRAIEAGDCGFQLFGWIPIEVMDRAQSAYGKLRAQAAGDYITDVKVRERWYWAFLGTIYCTDLQAKAHRRQL